MEPVGVVAGGDEELSGGVGADAVQSDEVRGGRGDERFELFVEVVDLGGELLVAAGDLPQRGLGGLDGIGDVSGSESGRPLDEGGDAELAEFVA